MQSHRPLHQLQEDGVIEYECMPCNEFGQLDLDKALDMITPDIKAVVMLHASNVSGTILPIEDIRKENVTRKVCSHSRCSANSRKHPY